MLHLTFTKTHPIQVSVTIVKYPRLSVILALLSMACFRLPLAFNRRIRFSKLMGTGADGHFSSRADLTRWAIFAVWENSIDTNFDAAAVFHDKLFGKFITAWWRLSGARPMTWILDPYAGHGSWSGVDGRSWLSRDKPAPGPMAVITRATVHWNRMKPFHQAAAAFGSSPLSAPGCRIALGIGEWPLRLQATFSVWDDEQAMKDFAYADALHQDIIRRTRQEGWYKEELFLRARVVAFVGSD